jgi:phosphate transport system substrate-binding protein
MKQRSALMMNAAFGIFLAASTMCAAPSHVVITVPSGAPGGAGVPALLAEWRQTGLVADAWLLKCTDPKHQEIAALAVLQFPDQHSLDEWQQKGAPAIKEGLITTKVDTLARGETFPRDSTKAIFQVAQYDVTTSPKQYKEYVQGYVVPEMESLRARRILTSYFLFAARDPGAAPWQSLLVMEYRDNVALGRREQAMGEARNELAANPTWKVFSDSKQSIRKERSLTQFEWELLPAPALSDLPSYKPEYRVTGTIRVLGSFLKFATANLEEGFLKYQPDAQFASNFSTSSEGSIGGLCTGISDLAPAGDDAKIPDMMPFYNVYGYVPLELSVATGDYEKRGALWPAAIVVNKDNPITYLTMDQLDRIFGSERIGGWDIGDNPAHDILYSSEFARGRDTNIRTWGQLGLTGDFANREIQTYGYAAPGFEVYFERKLFHWVDKWNGNLRQYVEPKEAEAGDKGKPVASDRMLEEISNDKYGIGWVAMFHAENYPNLKVLAIAAKNGGPSVAYTPENVANRTYPLTRDAYFYVNREPGRPLDPKVREFMRFVLSREGQQIIAHTGFFYPLPADYLREQLRKLD